MNKEYYIIRFNYYYHRIHCRHTASTAMVNCIKISTLCTHNPVQHLYALIEWKKIMRGITRGGKKRGWNESEPSKIKMVRLPTQCDCWTLNAMLMVSHHSTDSHYLSQHELNNWWLNNLVIRLLVTHGTWHRITDHSNNDIFHFINISLHRFIHVVMNFFACSLFMNRKLY